MNDKLRGDGVWRRPARAAMLMVLLLAGCAQWPLQSPPPPAPVAVTPAPAPVATKTANALPPLDVIVIAHQRQCKAPASAVAGADDAPQLRDLMQWLKRSCGLGDATLAPQLTALKQLRQRYTWPDAYGAWLDEWRQLLARMQVLQQRAVTAEEAQATMVQRLRAIERDLTTRP